MDELLSKMAEHIQCCVHLHMQGMGETLVEMNEIVKKLKTEGVDFDKFSIFSSEKFKISKEEFEQDPIVKKVKDLFMME